MHYSIIVVLISVWVWLVVGRGVFVDIDTETIQAIPLRDAEPPIAVGADWSDCTKAGSKAKLNSLTFSPNPPQKGKNFTITVDVNFSEEVTSGKLHMNVFYGPLHLLNKDFDLCSEVLVKTDAKCPIKVGTQTIAGVEDLPSFIPSGTYTGNGTVIDQTGNDIICVKFNLKF